MAENKTHVLKALYCYHNEVPRLIGGYPTIVNDSIDGHVIVVTTVINQFPELFIYTWDKLTQWYGMALSYIEANGLDAKEQQDLAEAMGETNETGD